MKDRTESIIIVVVLTIIFLTVSYLTQIYFDQISSLVEKSPISILVFVCLFVLMTIIVPLSAAPLFPVATNIWGMWASAILGIIGWMIATYIAFALSRKFGVRLIKKIINEKKLGKIQNVLPSKNVFWSIIIMRIFLPVDIISYVFGLFSNVKISTYLLATLIGVIPISIFLAFLGGVPIKYQALYFGLGFMIFFFLFLVNVYYARKRKSSFVVVRIYGKGKHYNETLEKIKAVLYDYPAELERKPWNKSIIEGMLHSKGAWQRPIVMVNNQLVSHGKVVDKKKFIKILERYI